MRNPDSPGTSGWGSNDATADGPAEDDHGASNLPAETIGGDQQLHAVMAVGRTSTSVDAVLARIGRAVLLPIQYGEKRPRSAGWQKMTLEAMDNPAYLAELNAGGNIGVLLGAASGNLCSIDIDHDEEVEPFLVANPSLRNALRTRRARGGNIWVRIQGSYPSSAKLSWTAGKPWGEWRADGCQTVIHGAARGRSQGETALIDYKVVQDGNPAEISFGEITWPKSVTVPSKPSPHPEANGHEDGVADADLDDGVVILPSGEVSIQECGDKLFRKIAPARTMFQRGGEVVEPALDDDRTIRLHPVTPAAFRSRIESFGRVLAWRSGQNGEPVLKPTTCPEETAKALLESSLAKEHLPRIATVVGCPLLIQAAVDELTVLPPGYHPESGGILVTGGALPPEVPFGDAVGALIALLIEFDFQTDGDRARALAQLITPAMKMGGFIDGFVPADVAEADQSQSGKTYRQRVTCAIYHEIPRLIARRDRSVGSVDESLAEALLSGRPFIQFDNLRGKLDSQFIEAFLTAIGSFPVRVPYRKEVLVDPRRHLLLMSSNGVETTRDMANRSCIIRIRKRSGITFKVYEDGRDLLGHVRARQPFYLGCVFAVIRRWIEHGKPRTNVVDHDFRDWAQPLDWIVQNLFGTDPLLDGHQGAQERVSNPALTFLRNLALQVKEAGRLGENLSATAIRDLCAETGLAIPGVKDSDDDHAKRQVGILMGKLFKPGDEVVVDHFVVKRIEREEPRPAGGSYPAKVYIFSFR